MHASALASFYLTYKLYAKTEKEKRVKVTDFSSSLAGLLLLSAYLEPLKIHTRYPVFGFDTDLFQRALHAVHR